MPEKIILMQLFSAVQFVNKLIYAREGAKDMMDRSCSDLPWHVSLEVDGKDIEIPEVASFISFMYLHYLIYFWRIFLCPVLIRIQKA
jgi:hypothetical protein